MKYCIREVDGFEDDIAETLNALQRMTLNLPKIAQQDLESGHWWIGYFDGEPVSYCGLIKSTHYQATGYYKRVGVIPGHRGRGLQIRHTRALERRARANGWGRVVSDTTDNPASANNFIKAGYRIFSPEYPWAFPATIYWIKHL